MEESDKEEGQAKIKLLEFPEEAKYASPEKCLRWILDNRIDDVENIIISLEYKDGTVAFSWSDMKQSQQIFLAEAFKKFILDEVFYGDD